MDRIVAAHQGYVASVTIQTPTGAAQSLAAELRIPAPQMDAALAELKALGSVEQEQQGGEEVSAQVIDLDARLKSAREEESRLAQILQTRTGKLSDVLEVEKEQARVRGEIEVMQAQQNQLAKRVSYAAISLSIDEQYQATLGAPDSLGRQLRNACVDGFHAAAAGLLGAAIFLINVGPSLLLWALILFWPARWAWRKWRPARNPPRP